MSNWNNNKNNDTDNTVNNDIDYDDFKQSKKDPNGPFLGDIDDVNVTANKNSSDGSWEQNLLYNLAFASHQEQKRKRRWGIFFKFLIAAYVTVILYLAVNPIDAKLDGDSEEHTALINVEGVIAADSDASADKIISSLRDAFKDEKTKGVILRMNTPGGSPVQSGYINDEIYRLKKKHPTIKVYAVISDVCASGGYYIAAAADEIYADKASIVGSIGVIMNGFGFVEAMKTLGVSRRLYTAGDHKAFLDPFTPQDKVEVMHINSQLKNIHEQFITVVKKGRGDKLSQDPNLFSGYFWTGEKALENGLVDKLGSSSHVAREIIKAETIVEYSYEDDLLERFTKKLGTTLGMALSDSVITKISNESSIQLK